LLLNQGQTQLPLQVHRGSTAELQRRDVNSADQPLNYQAIVYPKPKGKLLEEMARAKRPTRHGGTEPIERQPLPDQPGKSDHEREAERPGESAQK
jgi:hypothetical protein